MAQSSPAIRPSTIDKLTQETLSALSTSRRDRPSLHLHFPSGTKGLQSRFRVRALNYIYRTALGLSDDRLKFASVSVWSTPDEEDSLTLDLTLTVDADWEFIGKLRHDILVKVGEWSQEWSEEDKEDYGRRIYFGIVPLNL